MKLNKLTATYGQLENQSLEPGGGLTIINAPNERGKSTWCSFIQTMLYGLDTSAREKGGKKPDKVKYAPWSGAPMSGSIDLTHNGRDITITRQGKASSPMKDFRAVYTGTNEPAGLQSSSGEELTGMPKAVFERSVFIKQAGLGVSGSPELEKRISAIVSTGEDDSSSYTEADERLRVWQRKRRYNRRGVLPELETRIAELQDELEDIRSAAKESPDSDGEIARLERRVAELEAQIQQSRKDQRKAVLSQLAERRALLREKEDCVADAKLEAAEKLSALRSSIFGEQSPDAVVDQAQSAHLNATRYQQVIDEQERIPSYMLPLIGTLLLALSVACIGLALFLHPAFAAVALLLLAADFIYCRKMLDGRKDAEHASESLQSLLLQYSASDPDDILQAADEYKSAFKSWQDSASEHEKLSAELEEMRDRQKEIDANLVSGLDFSGGGSNEAAELSRQLNHVRTQLSDARETAAHLSGRLKTMGDPMVIESELLSLNEEKAELEQQYSSLALAIETLYDANIEIQSRFSPRLGKRAGELMSRLTAGRYDALTLDRQLSAMAKRSGDIIAHESAFLSAGALDQLYFALRIAICELALPDGESCPMILDDALLNFDDERMALALDLLLELSENRQILLFTCHRREADYFKANTDVKIISPDD